uniref:Uncharacterized protein n=1 Tax=viral metagenome TaxID=1070528 RepID=A0A6C0BN92_9ZZZZ
MASLPRSENNSLRYHYLDNGVNNESRNMPMAAADFGAETGAYFLKSTPMTAYPEYKLEPDPHCRKNAAGLASMEELIADHAPSHVKKSKRKRSKTPKAPKGAQVAGATDTAGLLLTVSGESTAGCGAVRWETLPACLLKTVTDVTSEISDKIAPTETTPPQESPGWVSIFTRDNRPLYLSVLFLLLYFVYRILRRC